MKLKDHIIALGIGFVIITIAFILQYTTINHTEGSTKECHDPTYTIVLMRYGDVGNPGEFIWSFDSSKCVIDTVEVCYHHTIWRQFLWVTTSKVHPYIYYEHTDKGCTKHIVQRVKAYKTKVYGKFQ